MYHCIDDVMLKNIKIESRYIQLPYVVVKDKSKEKTSKLNLPPNYKKHILFDKLPYSVQLENPTLKVH